MSITVIIARDDDGAPTSKDVYEEAVKFTHEGGDLSIVSGRPQLLALYGSGNWLSVHVDNFMQNVVEKKEEEADDDDPFSFGDDDSGDSSDDEDPLAGLLGDDSDTDTEDSSSDDSPSTGDPDLDELLKE